MIIIASIFITSISFAVFFYLFANVFTPLLFDISATIKLGRKSIIKKKPVLKKLITTILVCTFITFVILVFAYYLFYKYSFGFSISIFIGASLALITSLWKMFWLFFHQSDNYSQWLDFYIKDNSRYLKTTDMEKIYQALNKK